MIKKEYIQEKIEFLSKSYQLVKVETLELIKQFNVEVNIVHGNISQTTSGPYGTLIVQIDGENSNVVQALDLLKSNEIQTEVIEHA